MSTIPLQPLVLPTDPGAAVALLQREISRVYAGGAAIAPIADAAQAQDLPATVPASTAVVLCTSGSSGVPKRTMLSRTALLASARASAARLGGDGDWLLCLPMGFVAGFQVVSRAVLGGRQVTALAGSHFDTGEFAASAHRMRPGRRYTALVPTQVRRLLADAESRTALAGFDAVLVGGAPMDPETARRLRDSTDVVLTYGMTETCGGCVYDGVPLDGVRIRIVDGVIHIGGDIVAGGYLGADEAEAARFYTDDGLSWYRTADRGVWADGRLIPTGRIDDLINTGGVKVSATAVEAALLELDWVDAAVVLGLPDQEWGELVGAYVLARDGISPPDIELLRETIRGRLGRAAVPKRIVIGNDLPLLPNSKIDRRAIRNRLTEGQIHV
ncbi:AMP-binding protein [Nocardia uniformis]|uniref:AMP-binding protein n=1 Tax=Nocardia uniformis TaxID=53432 RepID=A0A849BSM2_9NOCA|nr:AMP-binding protein [Nocardia uniformis]NNH69622.1 AMP-binding protein [Nocardia uniformis]